MGRVELSWVHTKTEEGVCDWEEMVAIGTPR
jgi:hypothetical protein